METADHFQRVASRLSLCDICKIIRTVKDLHYIPEHYMDLRGEPIDCRTRFGIGQDTLRSAAEARIQCMPYTVNYHRRRYAACAYSFSLTFV